MIEVQRLGWPKEQVGELDHRRLKAPSVKLRSLRMGVRGDVVYCVDLRVRRPNTGAPLSSADLHSTEHFLLEGLQRLLPQHFIAVGVMGCRTGFYLTFLNEGRAEVLCAALARIFEGTQTALQVPYARVDQCGNWRDHSIERARAIATEIMARRADWLDAA